MDTHTHKIHPETHTAQAALYHTKILTHAEERLIAVRWGNKEALWGMEKSLITVRWRTNTHTGRHTLTKAHTCCHARGQFPVRSSLKGSIAISLSHSESLSPSLHAESEVAVLCRKFHVTVSVLSVTQIKVTCTLTCQTWLWTVRTEPSVVHHWKISLHLYCS